MCYVDISGSKATDSGCMAGKVRDAWGIVPFCNGGRKWSFLPLYGEGNNLVSSEDLAGSCLWADLSLSGDSTHEYDAAIVIRNIELSFRCLAMSHSIWSKEWAEERPAHMTLAEKEKRELVHSDSLYTLKFSSIHKGLVGGAGGICLASLFMSDFKTRNCTVTS